MRPLWHRMPLGLSAASALLSLATVALLLSDTARAAPRKDKPQTPAVRWDEQRPGCTFSRSDDGHYIYGLWYEEVGIILSVDSQELEKVDRRHEPFFGALLSIRYHGQGSLDLSVQNISLEFVKHFKVVQPALDPDTFSEKVQDDANQLDHQSAREAKKHPEKKEALETAVRAFLKDSAELQEFVGKSSLRPTRMGPGNPEIRGWVLFSTESKWMNGWKKQEEFILRVPIAGTVFEFPFKLPPAPGEVMLRKRE
jgi:hypothetical protein